MPPIAPAGVGTGRGGERTGARAVRDVAARHGVSVDQVAVAAAVAQPWVDVVLSGAVTQPQLAANVAALELELSDEDRDRLRSAAEDRAAYWDGRAALPWT